MNDFLHSLRTGKDKRYDRTRRGHDNAPYRPNDRHNSMDKRKRGNYSKGNVAENAYVTIAKLLPPVKTLLETIVASKKDFLEIEERKAVAMETIALHLKQHVADGRGENPVIPTQKEMEDTASIGMMMDSDNTDTMEAKVATVPKELIKDMRAKGFSYEKIARQLDMDNIPTPSGRGKWRGQAVSKLLNKGL